MKNFGSFIGGLFFFSVLLWFFYPILGGERAYYARDFQLLFYPMKYHLARSYGAGEIPFWFGDSFCGAPFLADMQAGTFYPPSLFFLALPFPLAMNLQIIFHFLCGAIFFYLFVRSMGGGFMAALLGASGFVFGGYLVSTINVLNNLQAAVWAPAVFWAATRLFQTGRTIFMAVLVFMLAMVTLGGEPQILAMTVVLLFLFVPLILKRSSVRDFFLLGAALALSQLLCAVQWIPTLEAFFNSVRHNGLELKDAGLFSLGFNDLAGLLFPPPFSNPYDIDLATSFPSGKIPWLLSIFSGKIIFLFACLSFIRPKREVIFLWSVAFLSVLLSLGSATPIYLAVHKLLPIFRFPEKWFFLAAISFPLLAAYGFDALSGLIEKKGVGKIGKPVLAILLIASILELATAHRNLNPTLEAEFYFSPPANTLETVASERVASIAMEKNQNSTLKKQENWRRLHAPLTGVMYGEKHAEGRGGLELNYQWLITDLIQKLEPRDLLKLYRLLGVGRVYSDDPRLAENDYWKSNTDNTAKDMYVIENRAKRFYFASRVIAVTEKKSIETISNRSFDAATDAAVEGWEKGNLQVAGNGRIIGAPMESVNGVRLKTEGEGFLVFTDSFYPGWRSTVDGKETKIYRTNRFFKGIYLEKGEHQVEFSFVPTHFYTGLAVSLVAFAVLIAFPLLRKSID